jgi:hypothetical protein
MNKKSADRLTWVGSEVPYSLIVQMPSPDLVKEKPSLEDGPQSYTRAAASELVHFKRAGHIPEHIFKFMAECVERGAYRVEILDAVTMYKLYVKPPSEDNSQNN